MKRPPLSLGRVPRAAGHSGLVLTAAARYEAASGGIARQVWAKVCAQALLDQAGHAGRDIVGIRRQDPGLPAFRQGEHPRPHEA
ncbi:hypothetical protein ALMP_56080 [Streptomyces sp. A012304]|nr:hypothetical protein ALMP_56080 [Streptomyces sp. A012304]